MLKMKDNEFVVDYFSRLLALTTQMKISYETLYNLVMIEMVLHTLTLQYDMIAVTIEETKRLELFEYGRLARNT